jgi:UDP-2,3-diacylglucosamine pyrophosphatase LpxH
MAARLSGEAEPAVVGSSLNPGSTPVPLRTAQEEREQLRLLEGMAPQLIVAVSDLHLGEGVQPATGRFFRRENFFADGAFRRFLERQRAESATPAVLVLNGDIFDFLRIDRVPEGGPAFGDWQAVLARLGVGYSREQLERSVPPHERTFGLQTDDFKSVYKFKVIARGHPVFFRALAEWVGAGGIVLYVNGNHDVEQYWPLVRRAFRDEIYLAGAGWEAASRLVCFADGGVTLGNVLFEHGHNYETMTRVVGPPVLADPPGQLNLPLGSFVNRYVINRMERVEPFLDNVKPVTEVLWALVRRRPLSVFSILRQGLRFLARALIRRRVRHALLALAIVLLAVVQLAPLAVVTGIVLFLAWPGFRDWLMGFPLLSSPTVRTLLSAGGIALPFAVAVVRELFPYRPKVGEDRFAEGLYHTLQQRASRLPAAWRTSYGVLGHTHAQDVQELPPSAPGIGRTLYVNTGTWIPLWPKERPDLAGRLLYSFARFRWQDGEYAHESLVWEDVAGEARPAYILTPDGSSG